MNKNVILYIYYTILLLILVSWTNVNSAPNITIRLLYLSALFLPVYFKYSILLPTIFVCFYTISSYGFAYSYLPTDLYIYFFIVLFGVLISKTKELSLKTKINSIYLLILFYFLAIDIINSGRIENITYCILICLLFTYFHKKNVKDSLQYLKFSFLIITFILSITFIIFGKNFINDYNTIDRILERIGWTDPNYFGTIVGMGLVIAISELIKFKNLVLYKLFLAIIIILSVTTLVLNASRGAILALSVTSVFILFLSNIKWYYKLIVSLLFTALIIYLYSNQYFELLLYRLDANDGTGGRHEIWITKLSTFFNEGNLLHWLFGYGNEGGFKLGYNIPRGFHNDFVAFLVDYGILGLILYIYILFIPVINTTKSRLFIFSLTLYLILCCMTLEPFTAGRLIYFVFYYYIFLLAQYSVNENVANKYTNSFAKK